VGEVVMTKMPMWRRYLRIFGPNVAADVETELVFHLDMRTQELIDGDVRLSVTWTERRPQTAERACHRDG
jgi:hypothetical protein